MEEAQIQAQTDEQAEREVLIHGYFTLNRDRQRVLLDLLLRQASDEVREVFGGYLTAVAEEAIA